MHVTMIVGRAGGDPKPLGQGGCHFSVATGHWNSQTQVEDTTWSHVIAFGKTADRVNKIVYKGRMVAIRGRYTTREYQSTKHPGETETSHSFLIDDIEPMPDANRGAAPVAATAGPAGPDQW